MFQKNIQFLSSGLKSEASKKTEVAGAKLLCRDTLWFRRWVPTFRRDILLPSTVYQY
jgi:hypothetical protein